MERNVTDSLLEVVKFMHHEEGSNFIDVTIESKSGKKLSVLVAIGDARDIIKNRIGE